MPYFSIEKIQIGPVSIYTLGFFMALGFLVAFVLNLREAKKRGADKSIIIDSFTWLLLGAIIGSRLGYILQHLDYYSSNFIDIFKIWEGGMTFHGGLLGLLIAGFIFTRSMFLKTADLIVLSASLGMAIGRIGCFLINDHQGAGTMLPWGITWPNGIIRHPVALYLIIANLLIFFILYFLKTQAKFKEPGSLFFTWLILYSTFRFLLDFTRSTGTILSDPRYWNLTLAQWLSIIIVIISIIFLSKFRDLFSNQS